MSGAAEMVEFSLTQRDFTRYSDFIFTRSTSRWRFPLLRRVALVMFVLLGVGGIYVRWLSGDSLLSLGDLPLIVIFLYLLLLPNLMRSISARNFRSRAFARVRAPQHIEISPAGVHAITGIATSMTPWASIVDVEATQDGVYLFALKNNAHIVPRHAFNEAAAFAEFAEAARGYWKASEGPAPS